MSCYEVVLLYRVSAYNREDTDAKLSLLGATQEKKPEKKMHIQE